MGLIIERANPAYGLLFCTMHCMEKIRAADRNEPLNDFMDSELFGTLSAAVSKKERIEQSPEALRAFITSSDFICKLLVSSHSENTSAYLLEELPGAFASKELFIAYYLKASDEFFSQVKQHATPDQRNYLFADTDWAID